MPSASHLGHERWPAGRSGQAEPRSSAAWPLDEVLAPQLRQGQEGRVGDQDPAAGIGHDHAVAGIVDQARRCFCLNAVDASRSVSSGRGCAPAGASPRSVRNGVATTLNGLASRALQPGPDLAALAGGARALLKSSLIGDRANGARTLRTQPAGRAVLRASPRQQAAPKRPDWPPRSARLSPSSTSTASVATWNSNLVARLGLARTASSRAPGLAATRHSVSGSRRWRAGLARPRAPGRSSPSRIAV